MVLGVVACWCHWLQVQLLLGRLPSPALIAAHGLEQYEPIIAAMRGGDVKLFNDTMDAQQFRFIQEVGLNRWKAATEAGT
jgi:hypothetical protein